MNVSFLDRKISAQIPRMFPGQVEDSFDNRDQILCLLIHFYPHKSRA